jgi:hypothetical protein
MSSPFLSYSSSDDKVWTFPTSGRFTTKTVNNRAPYIPQLPYIKGRRDEKPESYRDLVYRYNRDLADWEGRATRGQYKEVRKMQKSRRLLIDPDIMLNAIYMPPKVRLDTLN